MKRAFPLGRALLGAAVIVASSAALRWATPAYLSPEWSQRLLGALLGVIVVVYANVIPKSLTSLARLQCSPQVEQAARRFAGWSLVLGGLGYVLAMLFAPLANMHLVGAWCWPWRWPRPCCAASARAILSPEETPCSPC